MNHKFGGEYVSTKTTRKGPQWLVDFVLEYYYKKKYIPGSSKCVKFVPKITQKTYQKGRNFTYLEDTGIQRFEI